MAFIGRFEWSASLYLLYVQMNSIGACSSRTCFSSSMRVLMPGLSMGSWAR